jgi:membrane-associated protease RseP (regulator of RpoE activity)
VAVDGTPVTTFAEFTSLLVRSPEKPLTVRVRRGAKPPENDAYGPLEGGEMVDVVINPRPMKHLGLVMEMGPVTAVQANSPALDKLKPGDQIVAVALPGGDGETSGSFDPMTLPDDLRRMAESGGEIELSVRAFNKADGKLLPAEPVTIPLRRVEWLEGALGSENDPVVATALGVAYAVSNKIGRVEPGSPAERAGLQPGDVVTKVEFIYPAGYDEELRLETLQFSSDPEES